MTSHGLCVRGLHGSRTQKCSFCKTRRKLADQATGPRLLKNWLLNPHPFELFVGVLEPHFHALALQDAKALYIRCRFGFGCPKTSAARIYLGNNWLVKSLERHEPGL